MTQICSVIREGEGWEDKTLQRNLMAELLKYADFHFTSEENIAFIKKAPKLEEHKQRHKELLSELKDYTRRMYEGQTSPERLFDFLIEWFIGHTIYEDQNLFENPATHK